MVWMLDTHPVRLGTVSLFRSGTSNRSSRQLPRNVRLCCPLLDRAREHVGQTHAPSGYNIGINEGSAAGQTVSHIHVHLIPRFAGDSKDPRGGVRWVIPNRADYWSQR